jgi:hypothetical protein
MNFSKSRRSGKEQFDVRVSSRVVIYGSRALVILKFQNFKNQFYKLYKFVKKIMHVF